jgi:hypothetical protein
MKGNGRRVRHEQLERDCVKQIMRHKRFAVLLVLAISFCMAHASSEPAAGVEGTITVGPVVAGPVREGMASSMPLANFTFAVANEKQSVTSFTTDAQGRFRVSLAPGHYTISASRKIGMHGCGPFDVDVVSGKMTTVEWECDTGIR